MGPTQGRTEHIKVAKWAGGTRKALLRFEMTGNNTVGVQNFRVDADYRAIVVKDCCIDRDAEVHSVLVEKFFLQRGTVVTAAELLESLAG